MQRRVGAVDVESGFEACPERFAFRRILEAASKAGNRTPPLAFKPFAAFPDGVRSRPKPRSERLAAGGRQPIPQRRQNAARELTASEKPH